MDAGPRSPEAALAAAIRESLHATRDYRGLCLRAVRQLLAVPARDPNARAAWEATPARDRHEGHPPPGAPIFWAVGRYGHVALSAGAQLCWTTDLLRPGKLDVVPLVQIRHLWGADLHGWTSSLNGVRLDLG